MMKEYKQHSQWRILNNCANILRTCGIEYTSVQPSLENSVCCTVSVSHKWRYEHKLVISTSYAVLHAIENEIHVFITQMHRVHLFYTMWFQDRMF